MNSENMFKIKKKKKKKKKMGKDVSHHPVTFNGYRHCILSFSLFICLIRFSNGFLSHAGRLYQRCWCQGVLPVSYYKISGCLRQIWFRLNSFLVILHLLLVAALVLLSHHRLLLLTFQQYCFRVHYVSGSLIHPFYMISYVVWCVLQSIYND